MPVTEGFRRQCRWLRAAALLVFAGLFLLLGLDLAGLPWRQSPVEDAGSRALLSVVRFLPGLGYLWALWAVQRALADLAAGRLKRLRIADADPRYAQMPMRAVWRKDTPPGPAGRAFMDQLQVG